MIFWSHNTQSLIAEIWKMFDNSQPSISDQRGQHFFLSMYWFKETYWRHNTNLTQGSKDGVWQFLVFHFRSNKYILCFQHVLLKDMLKALHFMHIHRNMEEGISQFWAICFFSDLVSVSSWGSFVCTAVCCSSHPLLPAAQITLAPKLWGLMNIMKKKTYTLQVVIRQCPVPICDKYLDKCYTCTYTYQHTHTTRCTQKIF